MDVLIIGGTGTISRAIVQALLQHGHTVTLYNRGLRSDPPPSAVQVIHGDRRERATFEATLQQKRFDAVIDMISYTSEDAASAIRALQGRIGHFLHVSTVMTYGPPFHGLFQDETAPLNGRNDGGYGANKVAADELLLRAYAEQKFPVTIIKPSFTYGPGHPLWRQVDWRTDWIDRLRKGRPILVAGDGLNFFQFLPAPDAAEAFAGLLGNPNTYGKIINLVNPQPITWVEWHQAAAAALGTTATLVGAPTELLIAINPERYSGLRANFAHTQVFRNTILEQLLPDWRPTTDRHAHIQATIEWMDRNNRIENADTDTLEDIIIAALRDVPAQLHATK